MTFILFFIVFFIVVVAAGVFKFKHKNKKEQQQAVTQKSNEYDHLTPSVMRELKILQESCDVIEKTISTKTLFARKLDVMEKIELFIRYEDIFPGAPFLLQPSAAHMRGLFIERFNVMAVRVAEKNFETYKTSINQLTKKDAKERKTVDLLSALDELRDAVIIEAKNSRDALAEIGTIQYQVEEIFSDISQTE